MIFLCFEWEGVEWVCWWFLAAVFGVLLGAGLGSSWSARAAWNLRGATIESAMRSSSWMP